MVAARLLAALAVGGVELRPDSFAQPGLDRRLIGGRLGHSPRLVGAGLGERNDRVDDRLKALMPKGHGAEHDLFGQLLGLRLDHQHALGGAGDHQIEL